MAKRVGDERELVRRAARIREDLADLIEQLPSAADDPANAVELSRRQIAENSVAQNLGVRDHRGERRAQIVRDVGEELRLERVARAQLGDFAARLLEVAPRAPSRASGSSMRSLAIGCLRRAFDPAHALIVPVGTGPANSLSSSASMDSSSCCRLSSDQYRPPAAMSSAWLPCSTTALRPAR